MANVLGQTATLLLARRGAVEAIEELIRLGASVLKVDNNGEGFLFYSLGSNDRFDRLAQIFLSHRGNVNVTNKEGVS